MFYAHRIVYYLQNRQNPGCMVVRHLAANELTLGWQSENGRDEKGIPKRRRNSGNVVGSKTSRMYLYQEQLYNLKSLCDHLGLNYGTMYQRLGRCKMTPEQAFEKGGIKGVVTCYD
jgi:hypothetical protein